MYSKYKKEVKLEKQCIMESSDEEIEEDEAWYRVEASRFRLLQKQRLRGGLSVLYTK